MLDPNTVTAAELNALATTRSPSILANHVYWMAVDAIREAGRGRFSVAYHRLPPVTSADYSTLVGIMSGRGFTMSIQSISDRPNGLRMYWFTLSW